MFLFPSEHVTVHVSAILAHLLRWICRFFSCHHPISPSLSSSQGSNRISRNLSARGYYTSNEMCWERLDFVIPAPSTRTFSVTGFRGPSPRLLPTMMEDTGRDGLLFGRESRNLVRRHLFYVRMMRWCAQISSFLIITRSTDLFFTFHLIKTKDGYHGRVWYHFVKQSFWMSVT